MRFIRFLKSANYDWCEALSSIFLIRGALRAVSKAFTKFMFFDVYLKNLSCFSCAFPILSWVFLLLFSCLSCAFPMPLLCFSYVFPLLFLCFSFAFPVVFLCFPYAVAMLFLCFSYVFSLLFLYFSIAFHMWSRISLTHTPASSSSSSGQAGQWRRQL